MKKKLNLLCAMIFAVLLLSLSENIYSMVWGSHRRWESRYGK